jgi:hypothetical protein
MFFMNASKIVLTAFLMFVLALSASAQSISAGAQPNRIPALKNDLHTYLNILHSRKGFSGEILVAEKENIIFQEAVGLASEEHHLKMDTEATYRIAYIASKNGTNLSFQKTLR